MTGMLEENRHVVEALRDALLDRHELIGEEILEVIRSAGPTPAIAAVGATTTIAAMGASPA